MIFVSTTYSTHLGSVTLELKCKFRNGNWNCCVPIFKVIGIDENVIGIFS